MADNNPKDDSFEDTDFDDLDTIEDEDDLGDESWDEFDDGAAETPAAENSDSADDLGDMPAPAKKTFVQKNFMLIVVAIVIIFGGGVGYALLGGKSPAPAPSDQQAQAPDALPETSGEVVELSNSSELPPMPAPIDPAAETPAPDSALTPMPTPQELNNTELAELSVEEVPATPAGKTTEQGAAPFDFSTEEKPAESPPTEPPETQVVQTLDPAPVVQIEPAPQQPDLTPQIEALEAKIVSLSQEKQNADEENQKAAEAANQQIADLKKTIETQEKKIAELSSRPVIVAAAPETKAPELKAAEPEIQDEPKSFAEIESAESPAVKPVPKAETPKAASKPASSKPKTPKAAPKAANWVMKSAQPGRATLSSKTTGDMKMVSVGDRVEGLGRITSISLENGRWTVRGTSGTVSR